MHIVTEMYATSRKYILKCIIPNQSVQRTPVEDTAVISLHQQFPFNDKHFF